MLVSLKSWMERFLEKPLYQAEIMRAEILMEKSKEDIFPSKHIKLMLKQLQLNNK